MGTSQNISFFSFIEAGDKRIKPSKRKGKTQQKILREHTYMAVETGALKTCCSWDQIEGNLLSFCSGAGELYVYKIDPDDLTIDSLAPLKISPLATVAEDVHDGMIFDVKFNPTNSNEIYSAGIDWCVTKFPLNNPSAKSKLFYHEGAVTSLATNFHHPNLLLSGSANQEIKLYDLKANRAVSRNTVKGRVNKVCYKADGTEFSCSTDLGLIYTFDLRNMVIKKVFDEVPEKPKFRSVSYLDNGILVAHSEKSIVVMDSEGVNSTILKYPEEVTKVYLTSLVVVGDTFLTCSLDGYINSWKLKPLEKNFEDVGINSI